jgi:hypothetical protein
LSFLQRTKVWFQLRDNEFDTATPGPSRPVIGIIYANAGEYSTPLGSDFSKILQDNLWDMYIKDDEAQLKSEAKRSDEVDPAK